MQQRFKNKVLKLRGCVKNILNTYSQSTDFNSNDWYKEANAYALYLSRAFNVSPSIACGVIAALSPVKRWDENKACAYSFFASGKASHTRLFAGKAREIKASNGEPENVCTILNGRKIVSFYLNILQPDNPQAITIDRHALSIILNRSIQEHEYRGITAKQYEFFVLCYRVAAEKHNISPVLMQSITWQNWRAAKGIKDNNNPIPEDNEDVPF